MFRRTSLEILFWIPIALALACDMFIPAETFHEVWWHTVLARTFSTLPFLSLMIEHGFGFFRPTEKLALRRPWLAPAVTVAAFAVACNNLPIIPLLTGAAKVTAPLPDVLLFALGCLAIGLFEETAFRGFALPLVLEIVKPNRTGRFLAVLISSVLFGCMHFLNLFSGAGIGATLLQVGYSFLIGGLLGAVVLATGRLLPAILCHALYDFCGRLVPTCGTGEIWDAPTVIITAVLALAAAAATLLVLFDEGREEAGL